MLCETNEAVAFTPPLPISPISHKSKTFLYDNLSDFILKKVS